MEQDKIVVPLNQGKAERSLEGNIASGLFWGILISIPLWISIFGWILGFGK